MKIETELLIKVRYDIAVDSEMEEVIRLANQVDKSSIDRLVIHLGFKPIANQIKNDNNNVIVSCISQKGKVVE